MFKNKKNEKKKKLAEWTYFRPNVDCNMLNNVCKRSLSIKIKHLQINHEYQTVTWNKRVFLWTHPSYWVDTGVVYYLHGQTGRFTVWTNYGLINFVEESRLPFVQISFIPIEKRPRRRGIGVEDGFEELEHEFQFGTFRSEKQDYLVRCSVATGNFPQERRKKCSWNITELTATQQEKMANLVWKAWQ